LEVNKMAKEPQVIDISHLPELVRLAQEVRVTKKPRLLRWESEDLAVLIPVRPKKRTPSKARPVTGDDALFRLIGIGKSGIAGGISEKKHEYFARASRLRHR